MIEANHLTKRYGTTVAVNEVSHLAPGRSRAGDWLPRPQRDRQVDDRVPDPRPRQPDFG